jgi:hypothetical protein
MDGIYGYVIDGKSNIIRTGQNGDIYRGQRNDTGRR